jgi:hypothetical protein
MDSGATVQEVFEKNSSIPQATVRNWLEAKDMNVAGAAFTFLCEPESFRKIQPPLGIEEFFALFFAFVRKCILENPIDLEWVPSRYEAAYTLANFLRAEWSQATNTMKNQIIQSLEQFYLESNEEVRLCLETGVFEHIFQDSGIRKFFARWLGSDLQEPYKRSSDWQP